MPIDPRTGARLNLAVILSFGAETMTCRLHGAAGRL